MTWWGLMKGASPTFLFFCELFLGGQPICPPQTTRDDEEERRDEEQAGSRAAGGNKS